MESSQDRENSQGTTENQVADDTLHKHGMHEVSSTEGPAAAGSLVGGPLGRMSGPERLEGLWAQRRGTASAGSANPIGRRAATPTDGFRADTQTNGSRVADDTVHKHGTQEVSSAEDAAAAASSVRGALERQSAPERLEVERRCMCEALRSARMYICTE